MINLTIPKCHGVIPGQPPPDTRPPGVDRGTWKLVLDGKMDHDTAIQDGTAAPASRDWAPRALTEPTAWDTKHIPMHAVDGLDQNFLDMIQDWRLVYPFVSHTGAPKDNEYIYGAFHTAVQHPAAIEPPSPDGPLVQWDRLGLRIAGRVLVRARAGHNAKNTQALPLKHPACDHIITQIGQRQVIDITQKQGWQTREMEHAPTISYHSYADTCT